MKRGKIRLKSKEGKKEKATKPFRQKPEYD